MEIQPIRKLILPVAGLGKRLQPLTFTTPKNLLPLCGRPIIEHIIDEAVGTSIEDVVLVISPQHEKEFADFTLKAGKKYPGFRFHMRMQNEPLGHGHALLQAADIYKGEGVLVRFCDDIIVSDEPNLSSFLKLYGELGVSLILLERVARDTVSRYGVVEYEEPPHSNIYKLKSIIEKPSVEEAPSDLIVIGGYILTTEILSRLEALAREMEQKPDALLITDLIAAELGGGGSVYGWEYPGIRLDCGTLEGYKNANEFLKKRSSENE
jgi:UTP--glucose-1-phosphate uridylyltransferase